MDRVDYRRRLDEVEMKRRGPSCSCVVGTFEGEVKGNGDIASLEIEVSGVMRLSEQ